MAKRLKQIDGPSRPSPSLDLDDFRNPPEDQGLSLNELSRAYAELLDRGDDPYEGEPPADDEDDVAETPGAADTSELEAADDGACDVTPRSILEAMLFVGTPDNQPLTSKTIAALMRGVRPAEVDELVRDLNDEYVAEGCPYRITAEGSGYRMTLGDEFHSVREKFYGRVKEARLSQSAVDVLAIVAYNQPMTREEVDQLRGKPSGGILSQMVRRELLCVERDAETRAASYRTTERFLNLFGLDSLSDLPRSQELDRNV